MARIPPDNEDDPQTSCAEFDHAGYEFEIEYPVNWKGTAELRFKNPMRTNPWRSICSGISFCC